MGASKIRVSFGLQQYVRTKQFLTIASDSFGRVLLSALTALLQIPFPRAIEDAERLWLVVMRINLSLQLWQHKIETYL